MRDRHTWAGRYPESRLWEKPSTNTLKLQTQYAFFSEACAMAMHNFCAQAIQIRIRNRVFLTYMKTNLFCKGISLSNRQMVLLVLETFKVQ